MKALVFGSRSWNGRKAVYATLDRLHARYGFTCIVTGAYDGIDTLAEWWAKDRDIKYVGVPAQWKKHGRAAGPMRSQRMLEEERPDLAVGFPGGDGTADMARRCEAAGIELIRVTLPVVSAPGQE